jgi:hypothetical protein
VPTRKPGEENRETNSLAPCGRRYGAVSHKRTKTFLGNYVFFKSGCWGRGAFPIIAEKNVYIFQMKTVTPPLFSTSRTGMPLLSQLL